MNKLSSGSVEPHPNEKDFVLARDPVGFRTLYYGQNDDFFAFATIKNALWNVPLDSKDIRFRAFNFMKDTVYPMLPAGIKRRLRMMINQTAKINLTDFNAMSEIMESLSNNKIVADIFSARELKRTKMMSKAEFYNLLSVLLAIDDMESSGSILESFYEQEFV